MRTSSRLWAKTAAPTPPVPAGLLQPKASPAACMRIVKTGAVSASWIRCEHNMPATAPQLLSSRQADSSVESVRNKAHNLPSGRQELVDGQRALSIAAPHARIVSTHQHCIGLLRVHAQASE